MNIITVQYERNRQFSGKDYYYYSDFPCLAGDIVIAPAKNGDMTAKVFRINCDEAEIEKFKDTVKFVRKFIKPDFVQNVRDGYNKVDDIDDYICFWSDNNDIKTQMLLFEFLGFKDEYSGSKIMEIFSEKFKTSPVGELYVLKDDIANDIVAILNRGNRTPQIFRGEKAKHFLEIYKKTI